MRVWRIDGSGRAALDGEETREVGGRWHRPGRPLLYTSTSCALALAEFLVHLDGEIPELQALEIEIPEGIRVDHLNRDRLPEDWREPGHEACCESGEEWLDTPHLERGPVLFVPSAVLPLEYNVVIDPAHPDAARVSIHEIHAFEVDERLVRMRTTRT